MRQRGIADLWLVLIGAVVLLGLLTALMIAGTSYLKGVEHKGYLRGKAEIQLKFDEFKGAIAKAGQVAETARVAKEAADRLSKEKADAQNLTLKRDLADTRKRLRDARAGAGGSLLPQPSPGAASPDLVTFDRALLERALREFTDEVEGLIAEGAEAVIDLDSARRWAAGR